MDSSNTLFDCIVVGSGHAGSCAALAAADAGCHNVLIVEKAPETWAGGNGYFTAGAHRTTHNGLADLLRLVQNVSSEAASKIDVEPYTAAQFKDDILRLGDGRSDRAMVDAVVDGSRAAVQWLAERIGVPFMLSFNRQAYEVDGRQKFWGGMALSVEDGGKGLMAAHQRAQRKADIKVWYDCPAVELIVEEGRVRGLVVESDSRRVRLEAPAVVLACGGFESSSDMRVKYLGPSWGKAKVRGTPYNTGDGFELVRPVKGFAIGDWEGCHSTAWDANAPMNAGDRALTNQFTKSGYPLGIMINDAGNRFVDEGQDFRNYTYAKFGRAILEQHDGIAFQIWDSKVLKYLRKEEYAEDVVKKVVAESVDELADKLVVRGLRDRKQFLQTLDAFNKAVRANQEEHTDRKWDPTVKDGLATHSSTRSLLLPKSNWALTIDEPPLVAVAVSGGITFTFGGLAIDPSTAGVISAETGRPIRGLFATGEVVGGLFYGNYPGGSGLTAGAVFAQIAGKGAGKCGLS